MGKTKLWWYDNVKKLIRQSSTHLANESKQMTIIHEARTKVEQELLTTEDGEMKLAAVTSILIKQDKNYDGVALELNYDKRVIQNWISEYIYEVGKEAGF